MPDLPKKTIVFALAPLFIFLLNISCRKDPPKRQLPQTGFRSHYSDTINETALANKPVFVTIAGPDRMQKFYVFQNKSGASYLLIKSDLEANKIYSKEIILDDERLIDVCGSKQSDDFYTLTATDNFQYVPAIAANAYTYSIYGGGDSVTICDGENNPYNYDYTPDFQALIPFATTNSSQLKKFNKNGELVWNLSLDGNYFRGNAIETDPTGNVYVLAAIKAPKRSKLITKFSSSINYYSFVMNEHQITLYKFSPSGQLLFKRHVDNLLETASGEFEPNLTLSSNACYVHNLNNLMVFDLNGNLLSDLKPFSGGCNNYLSEVISSPYIPNAYIIGGIAGSNTVQRYCVIHDGSSSVPIATPAAIPSDLLAVDRLQNIYAGYYTLAKYSHSGNEIFDKALLHGGYNITVNDHSIAIDAKNNFYCFFPENQRLWIFKLDSDGNYQ